ncbi:hypothetical protein [Clostridium sp.]|uniref:hypothetical protein n=1 Tax=Clostridium sp. TaxID=1506 RepID=UPI0039921365
MKKININGVLKATKIKIDGEVFNVTEVLPKIAIKKMDNFIVNTIRENVDFSIKKMNEEELIIYNCLYFQLVTELLENIINEQEGVME